jgi:hypothetical protein
MTTLACMAGGMLMCAILAKQVLQGERGTYVEHAISFNLGTILSFIEGVGVEGTNGSVFNFL